MKTRVLSIRIPYETIAYCYKLQETVGMAVKGKTVSTVVAETLEAMVEASRRLYDIPELTQDEAAAYIGSCAYYIPGFEPVEPKWKILDSETSRNINLKVQQAAIETFLECPRRFAQKQNPAVEEKTRPTEPSGENEAELADKPVWGLSPVDPRLVPPVVDNAAALDYEDTGENYPDGPWAEGWKKRSSPAADVEDAVERLARAEEDKDTEDMVKKVDLGIVERVSPDLVPETIPRCPWEGMTMLAEHVVEFVTIYVEALKIDELMGLAARVVMAVVPQEEWNSDRTINLIKKTYRDYKEWREKYGREEDYRHPELRNL